MTSLLPGTSYPSLDGNAGVREFACDAVVEEGSSWGDAGRDNPRRFAGFIVHVM
jgi:hypothetical protein